MVPAFSRQLRPQFSHGNLQTNSEIAEASTAASGSRHGTSAGSTEFGCKPTSIKKRSLLTPRFKPASLRTSKSLTWAFAFSLQTGERWGNASQPLTFGTEAAYAQAVNVEVTDVRPWSPEDPFLYRVQVTLRSDQGELDQMEERFAFKSGILAAAGYCCSTGLPTTSEGIPWGGVDPIEGVMPPRKAYYLNQYRVAKSYGFNHVRYHSWVPLKEAFQAADEVGIFIHGELAVLGTGLADAESRLSS